MKKYTSGSFTATKYAIYKEDTDIITSFPTEIIADGENASATVYGNMVQSGTPTPTTPIQPQECGDLETTGTHAGQYKIPITSASTTTPVYLGEVQTTRKIKKLVLTGDETDWLKASSTYTGCFYKSTALSAVQMQMYCTHLPYIAASALEQGTITISTSKRINLWFEQFDENTTVADFKAYLSQQYAAGTPVTVWYVLATPETAVVNEPLRKIGDYADTVSTTIPTVAAADNINVTTTLKPSAVYLTYTGWHKYDDKKRSGGAWT